MMEDSQCREEDNEETTYNTGWRINKRKKKTEHYRGESAGRKMAVREQ